MRYFAAFIFAFIASAESLPPNTTLVYVGTHTGGKSKGIYVYRLQTSGMEVSQNITLVPLGLAVEAVNPSYIELDIKRRVLFAVSEVDQGAVSAFSIGDDAKLTLLNQQPTKGSKPCRLAIDKEDKTLSVTNCGSGTIASVPIASDGRLGEAVLVDKPTPNLVFRPDGRFAYAANEKKSTITAFEAKGLKELQTISTVPEYYDGPNQAGELGMHPSGKYLYISNRGHNSVVLFEIDPAAGTLTYVEEQGTGGKNPVHFGIQPSAAHLAIANHDSDTVLVSRIDSGNGRLKPSGLFAEAPSPSCVRFLPPKQGK